MNLSKQLKSSSARAEALLCSLLFSLPLGLEALTSILIIFFVVHTLLFTRKATWGVTMKTPVVWAAILFFMAHAISLLWSQLPQDGLRQIETKLSFILLAPLVFAVSSAGSPGLMRRGQRSFVWGAVAVFGLALLDSIRKVVEEGSLMLHSPGGTYRRFAFSYEELAEPFMHPAYSGLHWAAAFLIVLLGLRRLLFSRGWALFLLAILALALLLVQSRGTLLALIPIVGIFLLSMGWRRFRWRSLIPAVAILALGALYISLAPAALVERYLAWPDFNYHLSGNDFNSATYRLAEWECAFWAIPQLPWYGAGVGDNWTVIFDAYRQLGFWEGLEQQFNLHNQYLETTITLGIPGLALLLGWLLAFGYRALAQMRPALFALVVLFALSALTESLLERAWAVILVNVLWPFMAAAPADSPGPELAARAHKKS